MTGVAVVGGGIVGLSVAHELAFAGVDVTVWDDAIPGGHASARAHGQVVPPRTALVPLWRESVAYYERLTEYGEFGWDRSPVGSVVLACDELAMQRLTSRDGVEGGVVVDAGTLRELEPAVSGQVIGGLVFAEGRRMRPEAVVAVLAGALRRAGVRFRAGTVVSLTPKNNSWRLVTSGGDEVDQSMVVLAAGLRTAELAAQVGHDIPLAGVRGRILVTDPRPPLLSRIVGDAVLGTSAVVATARPTLDALSPAGPPEIALLAHQRADGRVLLGASWSLADAPDPGDLDTRIARHALTRLPGLASARLTGGWSGVRPCTLDGLPVIGALRPNLFVCCGHGGDGFIAGPGSARLLVQLMTGPDTYTDPSPFAVRRSFDTNHSDGTRR